MQPCVASQSSWPLQKRSSSPEDPPQNRAGSCHFGTGVVIIAGIAIGHRRRFTESTRWVAGVLEARLLGRIPPRIPPQSLNGVSPMALPRRVLGLGTISVVVALTVSGRHRPPEQVHILSMDPRCRRRAQRDRHSTVEANTFGARVAVVFRVPMQAASPASLSAHWSSGCRRRRPRGASSHVGLGAASASSSPPASLWTSSSSACPCAARVLDLARVLNSDCPWRCPHLGE